jgi:hypothetical protein
MRLVFAIILSAAAVTFAYNRDSEKAKTKCLAFLVAAGIIAAAQNIVAVIMP